MTEGKVEQMSKHLRVSRESTATYMPTTLLLRSISTTSRQTPCNEPFRSWTPIFRHPTVRFWQCFQGISRLPATIFPPLPILRSGLKVGLCRLQSPERKPPRRCFLLPLVNMLASGIRGLEPPIREPCRRNGRRAGSLDGDWHSTHSKQVLRFLSLIHI